MPQYLRPEARTVEWRWLDAAQRELFRQVVKMITEAIDTLPDLSQRRDPRRDVTGWLSRDRASRMVFLSGGRGMGKTTVLLSLIKASTEDTTSTVRETFPEDVHYGINLMRERVIWLEPIDMEPMPQSV